MCFEVGCRHRDEFVETSLTLSSFNEDLLFCMVDLRDSKLLMNLGVVDLWSLCKGLLIFILILAISVIGIGNISGSRWATVTGHVLHGAVAAGQPDTCSRDQPYFLAVTGPQKYYLSVGLDSGFLQLRLEYWWSGIETVRMMKTGRNPRLVSDVYPMILLNKT